MNAICASENFDFFMELSFSRHRDHNWKIPAQNGPKNRRHVSKEAHFRFTTVEICSNRRVVLLYIFNISDTAYSADPTMVSFVLCPTLAQDEQSNEIQG
jgi:hypothetical protein